MVIRYASIKTAIEISAQVRQTFEVLRRIKVFAPKSVDMANGTRATMGMSWKAERPNTSTSASNGRTVAMVRIRRWRSFR